jgi:hypothetical protein
MTPQQRSVLLLFCVCGFLARADQASEPFVTSENVATSFRYDGDLMLRDITASTRKTNPGIIWSGHFTASDNTFAPTTITVAKGGSLLTPELSRHLEDLVRSDPALAQSVEAPPLAQRIPLSDEAKGFIFQSGVGPGGFGYSAVATTADGVFDFVVSLQFASSSPIGKTDRTAPYYEALMKKGEAGVPSVLEEITPRLFAVVKPRFRDMIAANQVTVPPSPSPLPVAPSANAASPAASASSTTPLEQSGAPIPNLEIWIVIFAAGALGLATIFIYRRKGRDSSRRD